MPDVQNAEEAHEDCLSGFCTFILLMENEWKLLSMQKPFHNSWAAVSNYL